MIPTDSQVKSGLVPCRECERLRKAKAELLADAPDIEESNSETGRVCVFIDNLMDECPFCSPGHPGQEALDIESIISYLQSNGRTPQRAVNLIRSFREHTVAIKRMAQALAGREEEPPAIKLDLQKLEAGAIALLKAIGIPENGGCDWYDRAKRALCACWYPNKDRDDALEAIVSRYVGWSPKEVEENQSPRGIAKAIPGTGGE